MLFGAVGDWKYDKLERALRPEQAILGLRKNLDLFANLRPAILYPELADASTLKPEVVSGLDILIIRELTGDIYFGQPRGVRTARTARSRANAKASTRCATRNRRFAASPMSPSRRRASAASALTSVDKANVLETFQFWRDIVTDVHKEYPDVELDHMYVDNAAMQLVRAPKKFDVIVTGNMFGDILSDEAAMLTGSIGMLPSASLDANNKGLYEPIHGSRAGHRRQGRRQSAGDHPVGGDDAALFARRKAEQADRIEAAVRKVLAQGCAPPDIYDARHDAGSAPRKWATRW